MILQDVYFLLCRSYVSFTNSVVEVAKHNLQVPSSQMSVTLTVDNAEERRSILLNTRRILMCILIMLTKHIRYAHVLVPIAIV